MAERSSGGQKTAQDDWGARSRQGPPSPLGPGGGGASLEPVRNPRHSVPESRRVSFWLGRATRLRFCSWLRKTLGARNERVSSHDRALLFGVHTTIFAVLFAHAVVCPRPKYVTNPESLLSLNLLGPLSPLPQNLALPLSGLPIIPKLTCWVCGLNPSISGRQRALFHQLVEPK